MEIKKMVKSLIVGVVLMIGGVAAFAEGNLTGQEIMDRNYNKEKPKTISMDAAMVITKGGKTLSRTMKMYSTGDNEKNETEKALMKFLAPADVKGSGFMSFKKPNGSTESYLWLPALNRVRRIGSGASDQDSAWFGSDFNNKDISGFSKSDFKYQLKDNKDGLFIVEAVPQKAFVYEKLTYYINEKSFEESKIEYWKGGKILKTQVKEYKAFQGYSLAAKVTMTSVSGSETTLTFANYVLNTGVSEDTFTERKLMQ